MRTIFELIDAGDGAELQDLLAREPEVAATRDEQGLSALMRAAYGAGDVFAAVRDARPPLDPFDRIMVGEADGLPGPDAWTPDGFTGLHMAAFANNPRAVERLLEEGADVSAISRASFAQVTPLGTADARAATPDASPALACEASRYGGEPAESASALSAASGRNRTLRKPPRRGSAVESGVVVWRERARPGSFSVA